MFVQCLIELCNALANESAHFMLKRGTEALMMKRRREGSWQKRSKAMRKLLITLVLGVAMLGFVASAPSKAAAAWRNGQATVYANPYLGTYYNNLGYTSFYV